MALVINNISELPSKHSGKVVFASGVTHWYQQGLLHCENGPAIERPGGEKEWYWKGKRHRLDGPAVIWGHLKEFWINGKEILLDDEAFFVNGKFRDYSKYDEVAACLLSYYAQFTWFHALELCWDYKDKIFFFKVIVYTWCRNPRERVLDPMSGIHLLIEDINPSIGSFFG